MRVVRSINDVIAGYRNSVTGLPNLHYIVLTGTDELTPMARTPDPVTLSPEENVAADLAFTTNGLVAGNALYNSAAENNILTDGAYGAFLEHPVARARPPAAAALRLAARRDARRTSSARSTAI